MAKINKIEKNIAIKKRRRRPLTLKEKVVSSARFFLSFSIIALLVVAGWAIRDFALQSPLFSVTKITLEKTNLFTEKEVEEITSISKGKNIFSVNLEEARKVLKNDPQVKEVIVEKKLPQEICFSITPRLPIMSVHSGKYYYPVDDEGVALPPGKVALCKPVVEGWEGKVEVGEPLPPSLSSLLFEILRDYKQSPLYSSLSIERIEIPEKEKISIYLQNRETKIIVGEGDYASKFQRLNKILKDLENREKKAQYIDLRLGEVVPVKLMRE